MTKHKHTESTKNNFSKLESRILNINDSVFNKSSEVKDMLRELLNNGGSTLLMATGGSTVVAYYLKTILEKMNNGIICEVIEPRDYFYKCDINSFKNLVVISSSGKTNGVIEVLNDFKGNKYLISEQHHDGNYKTVSWGNELYDGEKSFISLATSLGPITLLLDATNFLDFRLTEREFNDINEKIKKLFILSKNKIKKLSTNFNDKNLIHIMSGYDTLCSSKTLESNIIESGLCDVVIHDKGSFCHGRSNILYRNPNSQIIYLCHQKSELDNILINLFKVNGYNISLIDTLDINENYFWKEYYLLLQMYYLSKKIATDRNMELTMPEYDRNLVKTLYKYRGEM